MSKKSHGDDLDKITREGRLKAALTLSQRIGVVAACDALKVSRATFYRRRAGNPVAKPRPTPTRSLSVDEREAVLEQLHSGKRSAQLSLS